MINMSVSIVLPISAETLRQLPSSMVIFPEVAQ
jgi:hypothetical protein